jgi:flagellar motor component MotA
MVDIPDNKVSALCAGYFSGGSFDIKEALAEISHELPPEREEIRFMRRALAFAEKARREGLLALEGEVDSALFAARDVFEYGISFVIDGEEPSFIRTILDALISHEHDPWKRKLMTVKRDAVLATQAGDNTRVLAMRMLAFFDKSIEDMVKAEFLKD